MSLKIIDADQMMALLKKHYFRGIKEMIAAAPEIVRCGDCEHRRDDEDYVCGHYCVKRPHNGGYFCEDNDYCSYGERKENEE